MSVRRCTRCERLYSDGEDGQCRYHPGQHYRLGWTCCRDPSFSAPGCRFGSHVEDLNMTRALDEVLASAQPVCPPAAPLDSASRDSDSDSTSGPEPVIVFEDPSGTMSVASVACGGEEPAATPPSPHCLEGVQAAPAAAAADGDDEEEANEERRGWFLVPYLVGPHDSFNAVSTQLDSQRSDGSLSRPHRAPLQVCMRHRMAPEELSRVNSLRHRSLRPGSTVLVWAERSETEVRARACTTHGRGTPARLGTMRRRCVPAPACVFPTLPPPQLRGGATSLSALRRSGWSHVGGRCARRSARRPSSASAGSTPARWARRPAASRACTSSTHGEWSSVFFW